jgi:hypothetical protein
MGAAWLQQVGADKEMVDTMSLPDSATVAELELFCQRADLDLSVTGAPSATSTPEPTPASSTTRVLEGTGQDGEMVQLIVRASPIADAKTIGPGRFEYDDQLGQEILARIEALRGEAAERSLALTNTALVPFGYRLESRFDAGWSRMLYDLYRQGEAEPLLSGLSPIWRLAFSPSVNASGSDFVLVAENAPNARPMYVLINSDGPQAWQPGPSPSLRPAFVGDALAQVTATGHPTFTYQVEIDARVVYTGTAASYGNDVSLRSFTTWDNHWLLEVDDQLIMDGQDLGQSLGYDAAFGFARMGGRSFHFFEQNGLVGISYGGQVLPDLYDQVFHNACCEAAIHNVEAGPDAVWFHALRNGVWYWVEAHPLISSEAAEQADE